MKKYTMKTRHALLMSMISLMTCFAMLFGATFAWFTDSVTSGVNRIVSGNLDVTLTHKNSDLETDADVDSGTQLFKSAKVGEESRTPYQLWEPGAMTYETFTVGNNGNLALKYQLSFGTVNANSYNGHDLREVVKVAITDQTTGLTRDGLKNLSYSTLSTSALKTGILLPGTEGDSFTVVLYWEPTDHDNDYNVLTDYERNYLYMDLGINLLATQYTNEADSFGIDYDANAGSTISYALSNNVNVSGTTAATVTTTTEGEGDTAVTTMALSAANLSAGSVATAKVADNTGITLTGTGEDATAYTVSENEDVRLKLSVTSTEDPSGFTIESSSDSAQSFDVDLSAIVTTTTTEGEGESAMTTTIEKTYKVASTDKVFIVTLNVGDVDLTGFYHNGTPMNKVMTSASDVDVNGEYYFANGVITFATTSFSPFTATYKYAGGLGTEAAPYVIDGVKMWKALVDATKDDASYAATAGKYFSVTSDIDVSSYSERMNIHYFAGHIDFNNHTIRGFNSNNVINDVYYDGDTMPAVFSLVKGDVLIENLDFYTSKITFNGGSAALSLVNGNYYVSASLTYKNINIYGTVTGVGCNNSGLLFIYDYGAALSINCTNCNNYATVIGSGYRAAFIGNIGYADPTQATFTNCHNYGKIVSTDKKASMLLSNNTIPANDATVTIRDCSNNGTIIGVSSSDLRINDAGNGLTKYKFTGNVTGHPVQTLTTTVLGTSNGNFVLTATDGATRYELNFSFTARSHAGGNVGYVIPIEASDSLPTNIFVGKWLTKEEAEAASGTEIVNHGTYYTCGSNYVFYEDGARFEYGRQVLATFIAYGKNNEMLSIATYTYPPVVE